MNHQQAGKRIAASMTPAEMGALRYPLLPLVARCVRD
jgi:hypothetical protein